MHAPPLRMVACSRVVLSFNRFPATLADSDPSPAAVEGPIRRRASVARCAAACGRARQPPFIPQARFSVARRPLYRRRGAARAPVQRACEWVRRPP